GLVPFGACFLHAMAELLAEARGGGDGGDALRIDGVAVPGPVREADPQASRIRTDLRQERPLLRRRPVGIAHVRSARRVEERRAPDSTGCEWGRTISAPPRWTAPSRKCWSCRR